MKKISNILFTLLVFILEPIIFASIALAAFMVYVMAMMFVYFSEFIKCIFNWKEDGI